MPIIIVAIVIAFILKKMSKTKTKILASQKIRKDAWGNGSFGSSRGQRKHKGIDLVVKKGEPIYAPISGYIRVGYPYSNDLNYKLIEVTSKNEKVKIFYVTPLFKSGTYVTKGTIIATADDIAIKYNRPSKIMLPHIHVEIYKNKKLQDPTNQLT